MKKELEARLKKLEERYGPKLEPERVTSVSWMSAENQRRGLPPGVYRIAAGDNSSEPVLLAFIRR
jgi:hypothetical protein